LKSCAPGSGRGSTLWIRFPDPLPAWDVVDVEANDATRGPIVVL